MRSGQQHRDMPLPAFNTIFPLFFWRTDRLPAGGEPLSASLMAGVVEPGKSKCNACGYGCDASCDCGRCVPCQKKP